MKRTILSALLAVTLNCWGQSQWKVTHYDEDDGLPHNHVTQLTQDDHGFMWFATWNGLCRFDGYEFHTFKPKAGDGCHMSTDRIRDIAYDGKGNIVCRVDDNYFLFNLKTYRFEDADTTTKWHEVIKKKRRVTSIKNDSITAYTIPTMSRPQSFCLTDKQQNKWILGDNGIYKLSRLTSFSSRLDISHAEVKCMFREKNGRYWIATKSDKALRAYSRENILLGFLGGDGRLHSSYTPFTSAVYCMTQTADGTLWLGTKPDGIFRLRETNNNTFMVNHFVDNLPNGNIYNIREDHNGRMWVTTLGNGICYSDDAKTDSPHFTIPKNYPRNSGQRARFIHITRNGILLVATTDGLIESRIEKNTDTMTFHLYQRQPTSTDCLSSSATMDIVEDYRGRIYVSTESGGINWTDGTMLCGKGKAHFNHLSADANGLPSDVVLSMSTIGDSLLVVSNNQIVIIDSLHNVSVYDSHFFHTPYRFSDAHPLSLDGKHWIFGLQDGAFIIDKTKIYKSTYLPPIVLTSIAIQNGERNLAIDNLDTLTLLPDGRSLTLRFAALDYTSPERIKYAFRLHDNTLANDYIWNYIGHDRSVTLLDLKPGTYLLEIRSTNADGVWQTNIRHLVIIVEPTFLESTFGRIVILLFLLSVIGIIIYTLLYIRRIKHQQHETLEAYLALLNKEDTTEEDIAQQAKVNLNEEDEAFMRHLIEYTEHHLSDSDINVGDLASTLATSRSGLQRKMKHLLGITPQDFLREARIKHACLLLRNTSKSIAEVAYSCGFTDPKYFSRCFKNSIGQSPSEYKKLN